MKRLRINGERLCENEDIEREIEETEEIFSRACDVSRQITKSTSQTEEAAKKPDVYEITNRLKQAKQQLRLLLTKRRVTKRNKLKRQSIKSQRKHH